jgi:hypothetical protein
MSGVTVSGETGPIEVLLSVDGQNWSKVAESENASGVLRVDFGGAKRTAKFTVSFANGNELVAPDSLIYCDNNKQEDSSYLIKATAVKSGSGYTVTIEPQEGLPNKTFNGQLVLDTVHGAYWVDLKLVSKSKVPAVTVSAMKANSFYSDNMASGTVTVKGATIIEDSVWLEDSEYYEIKSFKDGVLTVGTEPGVSVPKSAKATLKVMVEEYLYPLTKEIKITRADTAPKYKVSPASVSFNSAVGEETVAVTLLNGKVPVTLVNPTVKALSGLSNAEYEDGEIVLTPAENATKLSFSVKDTTWSKALSFNVSLKRR